MLRFVSDQPEFHGTLTRREWLRIGTLGGLTLSSGSQALQSPAVASTSTVAARGLPGFGKARSVLLIYASGGQSQNDIWDMKPHAPEEIRGVFQPIATSVPGIRICEHMPRLARMANLYTILRSVSHDDVDHGSASYLALTGLYHSRKSSNPLPQPTDYPTYGAILQRVRPSGPFPQSAVHINGPALVPETVAPGQFAGFLGHGCEPVLIGDVSQDQAPIRGLDALPELPPVRLEARRSLLESVDGYRRTLHRDRTMMEMNSLYRQAYELLSSHQCRRAFDLAQEASAVRDRYGRNRSGQACLLARRLVEAGVPLITVVWNHTNRGQDKEPAKTDWYGWDTHNDIFDALKMHLLPRFDQGFSALLADLDQRGLLDQTLVVCMGEFGRAPRVALERRFAGTSPGRKHWASVYSIVLAGAGIAKGNVWGASDRIGAYPQANPVGPWDVAATMFHALGIKPATSYTDPGGRPYPVSIGTPITGLYSG